MCGLNKRVVFGLGMGLVLSMVFLTGAGIGMPSLMNHAASTITLVEWMDLRIFTPVILWPAPEGTSLWFPPRCIDGPACDYIELFYTGDFVGTGVEPPMYMLYESDSELPIGKSFLTSYAATNAAVTLERIDLVLDGKAVLAEIRENAAIPDSGVALFELDDAFVVYHWRHVPRTAALDVLEHRILQVRQDDLDVISAFDRALINRFQ